MGRIVDASPKASSEIEMLSRIGYNLNSAISDIIDNSLHALHLNKQKKPSIYIEILPGLDSPKITIRDNGIGMNAKELKESMIIGCKNPNDLRGEMDLGRFGSGMKTASFSQASILTVISKKSGNISGTRFNKELIKKTNRWDLELLNKDDFKELHIEELKKQNCGTLVIWDNLTRYNDQDSSHQDNEKLINKDIVDLQKHLSHFFHRFMGTKKISFFVNGTLLEPFDPFLSTRPGYQEGTKEKFRTRNGDSVNTQYHIIPHVSKLTTQELDQLGGKQELTSKQGLYIYRADRLIIEGDWMGINPKTEMNGLVRIEVNLPTSLDKDWSIDVQKSKLELPPRIKSVLKRLSSEPRKRSIKEIKYKGDKEKANTYWSINDDSRENIITYEISTENKEVVNLVNKLDKESLKALNLYLKELALNLPLNHIANSINTKPKDIKLDSIDFSILEEELKTIWKNKV